MREVNILLADVLKHIREYETKAMEYAASTGQQSTIATIPGQTQPSLIIPKSFTKEAKEKIEQALKFTLTNILESSSGSFTEVFGMRNFLPIYDCLRPSTQNEVAKGILKAFTAQNKNSLPFYFRFF